MPRIFAVYKEAVELCVHLCKLYGLTEKNIIGHYEGYQQGIASNHGDPRNWFPKFGKSMDSFRADVKELLGIAAPMPSPTPDTDVDIKVGDLVAIKSGTATYHPSGSKIPSWVNRKAIYQMTCANCGRPFDSYGNQNRKYCCHDCYIAERFGKEARS